MRIQLSQREIEVALKQYISSQGISLANKECTISFTATRSHEGVLADIDLTEIVRESITLIQAIAPVPAEVTAPDEAAPAAMAGDETKKSLFGA
jgi:hypothetical protein